MPDAGLPFPDAVRAADIVAFNLAPINYVDDSWLDEIPHGDLVRVLRMEPRNAARLSQYLLAAFELENAFFDDFAEPRSRLALLDPEHLQTLFLRTGVALRHEELRNVLDRDRLARLRNELGPEVIEFAIKRVPLLGKLPVFDFEPESEEPRTRMTLIGAAFSLSPRVWQDPAYSRRVSLKLPCHVAKGLSTLHSDHGSAPENGSLPPLTRRLIKEFAEGWQFLFA
jgi:hypothetical protein